MQEIPAVLIMFIEVLASIRDDANCAKAPIANLPLGDNLLCVFLMDLKPSYAVYRIIRLNLVMSLRV